MRKVLLAVVIAIPVLWLAYLLAASVQPTASIDSAVTALGMETPVKVHVESAHGLRHVNAAIEQKGKSYPVFEQSSPSTRFFPAHNQPAKDLQFNAGKKQAAGLEDGPAKLIVNATANDLRGSTTTITKDVEVNTKPLMLSVDGEQHYVNQGGSELVTFTVSGSWTEAGVRVGKYTFRSFPMPGETDQHSARRFSLFAYPWDLPANVIPVVYARNSTGKEVTGGFWFKLFPKTFRKRDIELNDQFLQKVAMELDPNGSGEPIDKFLRVNRDMRKTNNAALAALRDKTEQKVLWNGPFYRLGQVESFFADERSYIYKGKKVDQQMHLGFDLSDVQGAPVKAANSGKVVHAGPLGIYGNCVVVDHGYGLQSIYGHMRQIDVKEGDSVAKEQVLGKSGATGLAAGDHLHYSMQVDGVQVNPLEWWDEHWIKDRILSKLKPAR